MKVTVTDYTWNLGKPGAVPGAMIRRNDHKGAFMFLPLAHLIDVSNQLVDISEQHETETTVKRDTTTNDAFQALGNV